MIQVLMQGQRKQSCSGIIPRIFPFKNLQDPEVHGYDARLKVW